MVSIVGRRVWFAAVLLGAGLGLSACGTGKPPLYGVDHSKGVATPASPCADCSPSHDRETPTGVQDQGGFFDSRR